MFVTRQMWDHEDIYIGEGKDSFLEKVSLSNQIKEWALTQQVGEGCGQRSNSMCKGPEPSKFKAQQYLPLQCGWTSLSEGQDDGR